MKTVKKANRILALLLAFAMVVSGIYFVKPEGSEAKAETTETQTSATVEPGMLNVKIQPGKNADGTVKALRFVSSVNSLNYKEAGFEVSYEYTENGETKVETILHPIDTVYERIVSVVEADKSNINMEYQFSPKVVDTSSEYFMTAKLNVTDNTSTLYTVKAYVIPLGGADADKIYGPSRCVSYEDCGATTYTNMSFISSTDLDTSDEVEKITGVTSSISETASYTAEVIGSDVNVNGGYNIHVHVDVDPDTLPSATRFTFGEHGETVFRNLYTTYAGTSDETWYNVYDEDTTSEYIIATNADLYGLSTMADGGKTFANKTVYVVSDIAVNPTTEDVTAKAWADATETPSGTYTWTPIKSFAGTFDGQMHTISGIYLNVEGKTKNGLFGEITSIGNVSNLYIKESVFKATWADLGSVAGINSGTINTVFSNAIIINTSGHNGGIVGDLENSASMDNCWFDGEIRLTGKYAKQSGGIVGYMNQNKTYNQTYTLTDCLYTGDITFVATDATWALRIGGIAGGVWDPYTPTINIENCISAGTITQSNSSSDTEGVSSVFGGFDGTNASKLNFVNVYGTEECFAVDRIYYKKQNGPTVTGTGTLYAESDLQGATGYQKTLLDFEDTWIAREGDVPALKAFDEEIKSTVDLTGYAQDQWYNADETVFGIGSADALKGFSTVSQANDFLKKTVLLVDDIDLNPGWTAPTDMTTEVTGMESFVRIGKGKIFAGTFDGREHTISGIYSTGTENELALFGQITASATVQNFAIKNSYFKQSGTGAWTASAVSYTQGGTIKNIYSEATIITGGAQSGGIVGRAEGIVENCWFNGKIYRSGTGAARIRMGGIVGASYAGVTSNGVANRELTIENCLNTGTIYYRLGAENTGTITGVGGILGSDVNGNAKIIMNNCVSIGTIDSNLLKGTGAIIGALDGGKASGSVTVYSEANLTNCYGAKDCISGRSDREVVQHTDSNTADRVTQTDCAALSTAEVKGATIYDNASIKLDYTSWVARTNDSPVPRVFVDWIVAASDTVEKPTE